MTIQKNILPIVILNWNGSEDTIECLRSLYDGSDQGFHVHLIDNNSEVEDKSKLKVFISEKERLTFYENEENLGFTKAHNNIFELLIETDHTHIMLLNNDTIVDRDCIKRIREEITANDPDMLSCKMINYWERNLIDNVGHKMLSSGEIIPIGHNEESSLYSEKINNLGACGGGAVYSVKMLKDIGFFDPFFETGYEDAEFGLRAILANYRSYLLHDALVYHKMGRSIKKVFNFEYSLQIQKSIFYTYLKLIPKRILFIHLIPFILRFLAILLIDIVFWRPKYLRIQLCALYWLISDGFIVSLNSRRRVKEKIRINKWKVLRMQDFFLKRDLINFKRYILQRERSYFEKY